LAAALLTGYLPQALLAMAALAIHEGAHWVWAQAEGMAVEELVLHPFGGRARVADLAWREPRAVAAAAAAGPLASLAAAALTVGLWRYVGPLRRVWDADQVWWFVDSCLWLGVVNLAPVLPLDGGQILRAVLSGPWGGERAASALRRGGMAVGAALALWGMARGLWDQVGTSAAFLGAALAWAAWREEASAAYRRPLAHAGHVRTLAAGKVLEGRAVVAHASAPLLRVWQSLRPQAYHEVWVVDGKGRVLGRVDEAQLAQALLDQGPQLPVGHLLSGGPGDGMVS
jgi:stage IV sporulation protein FB